MARSGRRSLRPRHDERLSSRCAEHTQGKPGAQLICPKPVFDSDRPQGESEPLEHRSPLKHAGCSRWVLRRRGWHKHQIYRPYNWWRRGRNLRRQSSQSSVLQRWGATVALPCAGSRGQEQMVPKCSSIFRVRRWASTSTSTRCRFDILRLRGAHQLAP